MKRKAKSPVEIHAARVYLQQARANRGTRWGHHMLDAAGRARRDAMRGQAEMFR